MMFRVEKSMRYLLLMSLLALAVFTIPYVALADESAEDELSIWERIITPDLLRQFKDLSFTELIEEHFIEMVILSGLVLGASIALFMFVLKNVHGASISFQAMAFYLFVIPVVALWGIAHIVGIWL